MSSHSFLTRGKFRLLRCLAAEKSADEKKNFFNDYFKILDGKISVFVSKTVLFFWIFQKKALCLLDFNKTEFPQ